MTAEVRITEPVGFGSLWYIEVSFPVPDGEVGLPMSVSWATFTRRGAERSARRFVRREMRTRRTYTMTISEAADA